MKKMPAALSRPPTTILDLATALARGMHLSQDEKMQIYQYVQRTCVPASSLRIGDKVAKKSGFRFPGELRSIFSTKRGETRVVVEADVIEFEGMLHIYSPEQLVIRK